ncbi:LysM peptidoglycan-binding domain-containing protein [Pseudarthrobacter psychrotolerans]|uniref:LysM peptidoglycan-binding domain-containing protein n=1 Tax=Pseudarthrobacter psychrotolerans TaxID=2697569 RepID=A0A6P1NG67_9MICC|nr:LysM peptidoglycan-binding domain-containing protein [Pseudarthrobacter psychrotolerans]QHK19625.1 LysM peptidoglycan-binding domain-containing protein [Pseudarthrobacter psychrotolerans]
MAAGTVRGLRADAVMAASILLLGFFLCVAGRGMVDRWQLSTARRQGPDVDDLLGAVAVAAGLAIVAWWIFSMILASTAAVLDRCGKRQAANRAGKCCPAFMRRLAVAALSVQLLSAPLAHAAVPPAGPAWVPTQEVAAEDVPVHGVPAQSAAIRAQWYPTSSQPQIPEPEGTALGDTGEKATQAPPAAVRPDWRPSPPVPDPGLMAAQPVRAEQGTRPALSEVTVLAGDTLWDIASRQLGPAASDVDVALHWPRWYEANKSQIGESPHVLLPGQILKAPSTA